jgi:hypothetical protein
LVPALRRAPAGIVTPPRLPCALLHDDGVRALRHDAAGEDAHRLSAPSAPANGLPANESPMRRRVTLPSRARSAKRTAQPSIAELS